MRKVATIVTLLSWAPGAQAGPRTLDDCEKIQDPMAYNACLASFGPTPKGHDGGGQTYPGVASEGEHKGQVRAAPRPRGAHVTRHGPRGRMHMEFTPGGRGR